MLPPEPAAVGGRLSEFVEGWNKRSLCVKYRSQGVQTSFYESTPPTRDPLRNKIPSGAQRNSGHAGTNIPYASEERDNRGASEFPRILLQRIPGTQSFRRVASSNRFKKSERSHLGTSLSYVHYKLSSEYHAKRRSDSVVPHLDDCLVHHPDQRVLLCTSSGPALRNAEPGRFCSKRKKIRAGLSAIYPFSWNSPTFGLGDI